MTIGDNGYALNLLSPIRHVATEMDRAAGAALSVEEMAATYQHSIPGDLARVKLHEHCITNEEATIWLIRKAVAALRQRGKTGKVQIVGDARDGYRFAENITFDSLRYNGHKLERERDDHTRLGDPFNPMSGVFSENIRRGKQQPSKQADDELRESLKGGWLPGHPAIVDEHGVILVGHRRLIMAKELGIEPETLRLPFGDGDAADIERLRVAVQSNLGAKEFSKSDRAEIAKYLTERGWGQASIAEALHVAQKTISNDLRALGVSKPTNATDSLGRRNPGRPPRARNRKDMPELEAEIDQFVEAGRPVPGKELGAKYGVHSTTVEDRAREARARFEERERLRHEQPEPAEPPVRIRTPEAEPPVPDGTPEVEVPQHACPHCGAMHPVSGT